MMSLFGRPDQRWWSASNLPLVFFRINTPEYPFSIRLHKADNPFLDHDSFLECNGPLDLDDYIIETFLHRNGGQPLGTLSSALIPDIWSMVQRSYRIRPDDKAAIKAALGV